MFPKSMHNVIFDITWYTVDVYHIIFDCVLEVKKQNIIKAYHTISWNLYNILIGCVKKNKNKKVDIKFGAHYTFLE
jgi:hypothetical protein